MPNFIIIIIAVLVLAWILTIPGLILLRLFKIRFTDHIEHLLYSIGVSIFLDIVIGLIINYAFLLFNSDHTFTPDVIRIVWGAIFVISSLMIIVFRKHISFQLQRRDFVIPGLIYLVTVIILYQTSLLTQNLIGSDIHLEYFYANQVVSHQYSDLSVFRTINICLPITIFLPMYSMLVGMDMMWVFKIIEPLILGVLPVVVYQIYKTQFNKRVSIIATVFIFTLPLFTMDIAQLIRQQYAMLFLVILVLLLINRDQAGIKKIFLCSLLGVGVIISHYGLGVGLLCYLGIGFIVMCILKMRFILIVWQKIIGKLHTVPVDVTK